MQLKERGREKLYPSTAVVTNPNGGRQSMMKVDRSFSVVVNGGADRQTVEKR
ncbi:hypothetical protein OLZ31_06505 [Enterobacter asburiae]|nr:hypothetical protein [Enterobacter asburiae]